VILNGAANYLTRSGYNQVEFIPRSVVKRQRTPDLCARDGSALVLCEVKTINISEIEATRRHTGGVGTTETQLSARFFTKLASDLAEAKAQIGCLRREPWRQEDSLRDREL
jgi:hypothetical protein